MHACDDCGDPTTNELRDRCDDCLEDGGDQNATTATTIEELLVSLLGDDPDGDRPVRSVATFEEKGVLTNDRGVVVRCADGTEFQISVVQSRR